MTIQNIEDVMSRIMGLNKNLTESSLNTLLSASGWDQEDIQEGLRIFRNTSHAGAQVISPIVNTVETQAQNTISENFENKIPINIQAVETKNNPISDSKIEIKNETQSQLQSENQNINLSKDSTLPPENKIENKIENQNSSSKSIIVITLILILLTLAGAYFYLDLMQKQNKANIENIENTKIKDNSAPKISTNSNSPDISNPSGSEVLFLQQQVSFAQKEISDLKSQVQKLLNSSSTNGNAKYITLKGRSGRGILNVTATSTGFIINYTDNTKSLVPFSTTTILNIINAQSLCLNNSSSSNNQNNLNTNCLDQESLLRLLSR